MIGVTSEVTHTQRWDKVKPPCLSKSQVSTNTTTILHFKYYKSYFHNSSPKPITPIHINPPSDTSWRHFEKPYHNQTIYLRSITTINTPKATRSPKMFNWLLAIISKLKTTLSKQTTTSCKQLLSTFNLIPNCPNYISNLIPSTNLAQTMHWNQAQCWIL